MGGSGQPRSVSVEILMAVRRSRVARRSDWLGFLEEKEEEEEEGEREGEWDRRGL